VPVEWITGWLGVSPDAPLVQVITGSIGIVSTILKAYLLVFFAILVAGYAYVWKKGALDWNRP
jgi:NAD(P)H-quinone oxidoreductase subunit 1